MFTNNFLPNLNNLYDYLNSLTLMQESAIYHIFVFISLILINFNILGILFGNEIINYFNLEKKFPSLYIFFFLRSKFNRYYLIWNVSLLFVICFASIYINLLVFSVA